MKNLHEYEDEIYKCSRCGLCQSVCPVFKASLNECAVSRGKFNILNGIIKNDIAYTANVKKYLDLCTGCNACKDFCPSQINVKDIFLAAKSLHYKNNKGNLLTKVINSYTLFKTILLLSQLGFTVFRLLHLEKLVKNLRPLIKKIGLFGRRILLVNSLVVKHKIKKAKVVNNSKTHTALYFEGCFNKYLNSETKEAVKELFKNSNVEILDSNFECCGVSYLNDGNIDDFRKIINKNLSKVDNNFDFLITDCASCNDVLKQYPNYSENVIAKSVSEKVISVMDLLKNRRFVTNTSCKVAVHTPCHEDNDLSAFVKSINGINYIQVENQNECCGFAGKFALQNQEISRKISKMKVKKYIDNDVDIILTTCPACILGLNQGLEEYNTEKVPIVLNLFVFLANFCSDYDY